MKIYIQVAKYKAMQVLNKRNREAMHVRENVGKWKKSVLLDLELIFGKKSNQYRTFQTEVVFPKDNSFSSTIKVDKFMDTAFYALKELIHQVDNFGEPDITDELAEIRSSNAKLKAALIDTNEKLNLRRKNFDELSNTVLRVEGERIGLNNLLGVVKNERDKVKKEYDTISKKTVDALEAHKEKINELNQELEEARSDRDDNKRKLEEERENQKKALDELKSDNDEASQKQKENINDLKVKLASQPVQKKWTYFKWDWPIITIIVIILSGTFWSGTYLQESRSNKEFIDIREENKTLQEEVLRRTSNEEELLNQITTLQDSLSSTN